MAGLRTADFAVLSLSDGAPTSPYPFDQLLYGLRAKMRELCDREMLPLQETAAFGQRVRLYMRPTLHAEAQYGDWVGEDGLTVHTTTDVLRRFSGITMQGSTFPSFHFADNGGEVTAMIETEGQQPLAAPAQFSETNGRYTIHVAIPSLATSSNEETTIRVRFSRFFVPKELGVNDDTRRLVVRPPDSVRLER